MKKNIILLVAGVGDFFFSPNSSKNLKNKDELLASLKKIISNEKYKGLINYTTANDTYNSVNIFKDLRQQSIIKFTLHSEQFNHENNEIALTSLDNEEILFHGNQMDYILPPSDYDIHICGVDINGAFKSTIEDLLKAGYHVTVYSDVLRPFSTTAKYISSISKSEKFRYCSHKSA